MLSQHGISDTAGVARGGGFHRTPGNNPALTDFLVIAESSANQRRLEGRAIATLLGLSCASFVGCVVGSEKIPLPIRTGLITFSWTAATGAYIFYRISEGKQKIYDANDKLMQAAIGNHYQYNLAARMQTLAEVHAATQTYQDIKRTVPEAYQPFALKRAGLEGMEPAPVFESLFSGAIDVPATDLSKVAPIGTPSGTTGLKMVPDMDELEESINPRPPYRDLSIEIADYDGHIAYVSKTRSGKTSSMIRSIQRSQASGKHVIVIDCKGDKRLRELPGIEYIHFNARGQFLMMNDVIDRILSELAERQNGNRPTNPGIDIYIDEYNLGMDSCADYGDVIDPETGNKIKASLKWCRSWKRILLQGAAANIRLRASAHTSRVEDWGWNTGILDSVSFVALGRKGSYESIEDLIERQISDKKKVECREVLARYKKMDFGDAPLVLTTLPPLGYCVLPTVDDSVPSTTPTEVQSGISFAAKPEPVRSKGLTVDDYFEMMIRWKASLDHEPTREEVKAQWFQSTRQEISEKALNHLMQILAIGTTSTG